MGRFSLSEWLRSARIPVLRGLLFLVVWLVLLDFPREIAVGTIDPSWKRCLGHFLTHRAQCGVDYVWSYGPLGSLIHAVYDADLFWWKYAWELSIKFVLTALLLRWAGLLERRGMRVAFVVLLVFFLSGKVDSLYLLGLLLLGLLPLRDESCRTAGRLLVGTLLLAALSLTKFTFLILGVVVWLVVVLAPGWSGRRRVTLAVGYPLAVALLWCLLGQALGNLPAFLTSSWEIARGYGEAMARDSEVIEVYAGLAALVLCLSLLAAYLWSRLRRWDHLLGLALLGASVFLVWKHGFIRQYTHSAYFFSFVMFVPFVAEGLLGKRTKLVSTSYSSLPSLGGEGSGVRGAENHRLSPLTPNPSPPRGGRGEDEYTTPTTCLAEAPRLRRLRIGLALALVAIGLLGQGTPEEHAVRLGRVLNNCLAALAPSQRERSLLERQQELAEKWDLPAIRQRVGTEPVDLISYSQGILFLNQLNYRPRPIFQSYSAYTPEFLQRNAAFYRSEQAPPFVLFQLLAIDEHFPTMEDGLTLLELFRRYRPVIEEKGWLLLQRRRDAAADAGEHPVLLHRRIHFGEAIHLAELGSMPKLISLHIQDTLRGRVQKALFRAPELYLELHPDDGETYYYRLIPGMAASEFLLDPFIGDQDDIKNLYAGQPLVRVPSFSLHAGPQARACYQDGVEIIIRGVKSLTGATPERQE